MISFFEFKSMKTIHGPEIWLVKNLKKFKIFYFSNYFLFELKGEMNDSNFDAVDF